MSLEALTAAFKVEGLTPTKKLILVVLANYADEQGACYPSHKHIAKLVGLKDHKGVQRTIKEFEEQGLLRIETRYTEQGGQTSNRYHLKLNPYPHRAVTPTPPVEAPPNTKEETKENKYGHQFLMFWKHYPRKANKHGANKSYKRLSEAEKILAIKGAENFRQVCEESKTEEQFIPHAQTWINNKRFEEFQNKKPDVTKSKNFIAG